MNSIGEFFTFYKDKLAAEYQFCLTREKNSWKIIFNKEECFTVVKGYE